MLQVQMSLTIVYFAKKSSTVMNYYIRKIVDLIFLTIRKRKKEPNFKYSKCGSQNTGLIKNANQQNIFSYMKIIINEKLLDIFLMKIFELFTLYFFNV